MTEQPTCGQGLAANSPFPAKMADTIRALSTVLQVHRKALDLTDENSRHEDAAYTQLANAFADIANALSATAKQMAGYRDLPMGRHDVNVMTGPEPAEAFANFVQHEKELLELLQARLRDDQAMLADMRHGTAAHS